MRNQDWEVFVVMFQTWSAPAWTEVNDQAYRAELNDCEPIRLGEAIKYLGAREPGRFRPSAWEFKAAYDRMSIPGPPRWSKAERMAAKAVSRRSVRDGEQFLKRQDGGDYVYLWLMEYGWRRFATEPQDSYTYNAQRKSYEEYTSGRAEERALELSSPRPKEVGQPRHLRLPATSAGANAATDVPAGEHHPADHDLQF